MKNEAKVHIKRISKERNYLHNMFKRKMYVRFRNIHFKNKKKIKNYYKTQNIYFYA